jgi:hypothetical protein
MGSPVVTPSKIITPFWMKALFTAPPPSAIPPSATTPVPVAAVLQGAVIGTAYSETISTQGGVSPYTYSVISGSLPTGLSLAGSSGVISGTPTAAATSSFTVKVVDGNGNTGMQAFQITVKAAAVPAPPPPVNPPVKVQPQTRPQGTFAEPQQTQPYKRPQGAFPA